MGNTPMHRLTNLELDFVSLVAAGDDPFAQVVISKADPSAQKSDVRSDSTATITNKTPELEDRMATINKSELDPDVLGYIEGLESEVDLLSKQVEDLEAAADSDITKTAEQREAELLSKADPAIRHLIEKANKEAKDAQDIAKAERDARLTREFISKAAELPNVPVDTADGETQTETLASLLRRAADSLTPADSAQLTKTLKAMNAQIEKSDLFKTLGTGGGTTTTLTKSVQAKAEDIRKAEPNLTIEQAIVKVYEADPDLANRIENGEDA